MKKIRKVRCLTTVWSTGRRSGELRTVLRNVLRDTRTRRAASSHCNFTRCPRAPVSREGRLDEGLEKHEQSLKIEREVGGPEKPNPDTAISLRTVGSVQCRQKNLNQAAEYLEQSLEMLRIVHGRNCLHPHIMRILRCLGDVYEEQGRQDDASAIRERYFAKEKTSDSVRFRAYTWKLMKMELNVCFRYSRTRNLWSHSLNSTLGW